MIWNRKVDRVVKRQREINEENGVETFRDSEDETRMEKGDFTAMMLAAMKTIFPAAIGALLFMGLLAWLLIPR